jgi:hypothetical protein
MGPQGPVGPRGEAGSVGPEGPAGQDGQSPVIEAQFPLVLEDGMLSFNSEHVSGILDKFKNDDIQKAIDRIGQMTTPAGGGAVDISLNGDKIIRSVNTMNFIGDNITVTKRRKNVDISIAGSSGGIGGSISSVNGISGDTFGNVNVKSLINGASVLSLGATGSVLLPNGAKLGDFYNASGIDLVAPTGTGGYAGIVSNDLNQFVAASDTEVQIGTDFNGFGYTWVFDKNGALSLPVNGYIKFPNGTTQGSAAPKFTEATSAPSIQVPGDRWFNTNTGILYTAITGASGYIWVQL